MKQPLHIAVVGHTNAGKTSLLRTLTRQVSFGEVSDRPGTTRHTESIELRVDGAAAVRFYDTPGLEDSVALLDYLNTQPGQSRPDKVRAFLQGPEARGVFEQEAKVLRTLLEQADAAMYVIDTREAVLPKHRAECEILTWCARPVMPVLNFVASPDSREQAWRQAMLDANLHVQIAFDAVAPFIGAERRLYGDLATLLNPHRDQLLEIVAWLEQEQAARRQAGCRAVADTLIDLAAMRRVITAEDHADSARQQAHVRDFREAVLARARRSVDELLAIQAFRPDDAELASLPGLQGRWEDDLFNPEVLKEAGKKLGMGAAVGAGIGAVADVALAGLSFGTGTTLGATLGGLASQGWRPLWRKIDNRMQGVQELTLEDPVLLVLTDQLLRLLLALEQRGHAAVDKLRLADDAAGEGKLAHRLSGVIEALAPARGHPEWEQAGTGWSLSALKEQAQERLSDALNPFHAVRAEFGRLGDWMPFGSGGDRAECLAEVSQALRQVLPSPGR